MKKTLRLNESDLHRIIEETVKRILKENDDPFIVHGHFANSNYGGKEVQISPDGGMARFRRNYGGKPEEPTDWLEIKYHPTREDYGPYCATPWGDEKLSNYMKV